MRPVSKIPDKPETAPLSLNFFQYVTFKPTWSCNLHCHRDWSLARVEKGSRNPFSLYRIFLARRTPHPSVRVSVPLKRKSHDPELSILISRTGQSKKIKKERKEKKKKKKKPATINAQVDETKTKNKNMPCTPWQASDSLTPFTSAHLILSSLSSNHFSRRQKGTRREDF